MISDGIILGNTYNSFYYLLGLNFGLIHVFSDSDSISAR